MDFTAGQTGTLQTVYAEILYGARIVEVTETHLRIEQKFSTGIDRRSIHRANVRSFEPKL